MKCKPAIMYLAGLNHDYFAVLFCRQPMMAMNWPQRVIGIEKWCRLDIMNTRPHHYE